MFFLLKFLYNEKKITLCCCFRDDQTAIPTPSNKDKEVKNVSDM